jgi:hypothetical protein
MKQEQENIFPYEALESLGINKKDLKNSDTDALLAGRKTDLMKFTVEDTPERRKVLDREKVDYSAQNGKLDFEGKVQLQKYMTADNTEENKNILKGAKIDFEELKGNKLKFDTNALRKLAIGVAVLISPVTALALMLVPKRTEIKNDLGLSEKDIKDLKKGEAVGHTNAKGERLLVQLDKDTNNLVSVRSKDISIPKKVAGQDITPIQKEQLKDGREIKVTDKQGQTVFAKIDLNEQSGLSLKDENGRQIHVVQEQTQKQENNQAQAQAQTQAQNITPKFETDKEKLLFIAENGFDGMTKYKQHFDNTFMEKYNLKDNYHHAGEKEEQKQSPEIKLSDDKERLQHIANNGLDGVKDIHPTNTKLRDEFLDKHNLSNEVKRVNEISKLSPEEFNKHGKGLNAEMDGLNNSLKSKANSELNAFSRENSVKNEAKTEIKKEQGGGFKMKM